MTAGPAVDLSWSPPERVNRITKVSSAMIAALLAWGVAAYFFQSHNVMPLSVTVIFGGFVVIFSLVIRRTGVTLEGDVLHADGVGGKRSIEVSAAPKVKLRTEQQSGRLELSVYPEHGPPARVSILDNKRCQPPENLLALSAVLAGCPAPHAPELATALAEQAKLGRGTASGLTPRPHTYVGKAVTVAALINLLQLLP